MKENGSSKPTWLNSGIKVIPISKIKTYNFIIDKRRIEYQEKPEF